MSDNLFDLTYWTARMLGIVREGYATSAGNADKKDIIDSNRNEVNDYWNDGTVWILYDTGGLAPEGEWAIVEDFATGVDSGTGTIDFTLALTLATAIGDKYAVGKKRYDFNLLTQKVNEALFDLGTIEVTDITTVDTATAQTEYTIPVDANMNLREVWIQTKLNDANDFRWSRMYDWYIQSTSIGTGDLLVFPSQPVTLRDIKLVYLGVHPELRVYTDKLSESVHRNRVIYEAALKCLLYRKQKIGDMDATLNEQINYFVGKAQEARALHAIRRPKARKKLLILGGVSDTDTLAIPTGS
jgi:hypothetical protein